jgi:hypothetical protein
MTIKLVDMTDTRSLIEQFCIPEEQTQRENRYARLAKDFRDALDALDHEEFIEWLEYSDYSVQDIVGMCNYLKTDILLKTHHNNRAIRYLRSLKPERIWTGRQTK